MRIKISARFHLSIMLGILLLPASCCAVAESACRTGAPEQAARIAQNPQFVSQSAAGKPSEYRTRRIVSDPFLHRSWALIEDCRHPERPPRMVALSAQSKNMPVSFAQSGQQTTSHAIGAPPNIPVQHRAALVQPSPAPQRARVIPTSSASIQPPTVTLIRAGDRVHLWSVQPNVRLEIETISLDYGHAGQVIHLRRVGQPTSSETMLAGIVVGKDSAELLP